MRTHHDMRVNGLDSCLKGDIIQRGYKTSWANPLVAGELAASPFSEHAEGAKDVSSPERPMTVS